MFVLCLNYHVVAMNTYLIITKLVIHSEMKMVWYRLFLELEVDPVTIKFDQVRMRPHLVNCFEKGALSLFPTIDL